MPETSVCYKCGKPLVGIPYSVISYHETTVHTCTGCSEAVREELKSKSAEDSRTLRERLLPGSSLHRMKELEEAQATPEDQRTERQKDLLRGGVSSLLPAGIREVTAPKPKRDLSAAFANVFSIVDANTEAEWVMLFKAFEAGELEQFRPGKFASTDDQDAYLKRMRVIERGSIERKQKQERPLQAIKIEKYWNDWLAKNTLTLPCQHTVTFPIALDDLAFTSWKTHGHPYLTCRTCGTKVDDPEELQKLVNKILGKKD